MLASGSTGTLACAVLSRRACDVAHSQEWLCYCQTSALPGEMIRFVLLLAGALGISCLAGQIKISDFVVGRSRVPHPALGIEEVFPRSDLGMRKRIFRHLACR